MTGDAHPIHNDDERAKRTPLSAAAAPPGLSVTPLSPAAASTLAGRRQDPIVVFVDPTTRLVVHTLWFVE